MIILHDGQTLSWRGSRSSAWPSNASPNRSGNRLRSPPSPSLPHSLPFCLRPGFWAALNRDVRIIIDFKQVEGDRHLRSRRGGEGRVPTQVLARVEGEAPVYGAGGGGGRSGSGKQR